MYNNYIDDDLLNQMGSKTYNRRKRIQNGIEEFIDTKLENDRTISEAYKNKNEVLKEELFISMEERFAKDTKIQYLNESTNQLAEETESLFLDILSETVIRSLNIEEKLVEENKEEISNKVKGFYNEMIDNINLEGSQIVVDLISNCKICSKSFDIEKHDSLYEEVDNLALIIKEKVANVIQEEKQLSKLEIIKEEDCYSTSVDIKLTLFKEMEIQNVKQALHECADRNLDKDTILLMSFYETIVDYTLLETFNTLKLLEFNTEMYKDSSRRKLREINIK